MFDIVKKNKKRMKERNQTQYQTALSFEPLADDTFSSVEDFSIWHRANIGFLFPHTPLLPTIDPCSKLILTCFYSLNGGRF